MNNLKQIDPKELTDNPFKLIGDEWMLITAGTVEKYNTMTASWGGMGVIWNKNVATIYVRPQRYTYEFIEQNDFFTLSFLPDEHRNILNYCGKYSGRDVDKIKECNLTAIKTEASVTFEQARLILYCKKLYHADINPNNFDDCNIDAPNYKNKDYHRMYIGEIIAAYLSE